MQVNAGWLLLGLALVGGVAWWAAREQPSPVEADARRQRAERAAAEMAEDARPVVYRWRDARGVLQVTDTPPKQGKYERVHLDEDAAIEVRGDR
jgi:hypothetical protein